MILVTGSLAFDHIMDFPGKFSDHIMPDKIHKISLSFMVNSLNKQRGGTAGNIAYNLALLNCPVSILSAAGIDFLEYSAFLRNAGVDTSNVKIIDNNLTSSAFIMTDLDDNQISAFYPGAIDYAHTLSLGNLNPDFAIISPDNPQAMVKFSAQCQEKNIPYMLDPGMQLPRLAGRDLQKMVSGAKILIANDYEIELLMSKLKTQMSKLLKQVEIIITTLGPRGSIIQTKNQNNKVATAKIAQVVDPTGAGDAYRAGFMAGYLKNLDLKTCGQMGATTACYAIEKYGTTSHKFSVEDFCKRYEENFGEELKL